MSEAPVVKAVESEAPVTIAVESEAPVVKAVPDEGGGSVSIVAPINLEEGYRLPVEVNDSTQIVTIPPGGVKEGQSFTAKLEEPHNIPSGKWRDGLCACFKFGCCHAMCWLGYCCQPILAGQVMTRMSRNFIGLPGQRPSVSKTFLTVIMIYAAWLLIEAILGGIIKMETGCRKPRNVFDEASQEFILTCPDGTQVERTTTYNAASGTLSTVAFVYALYLLIAACNTRAAIRQKYNIPPGMCGACDDCCVSFWCLWCATEQMARHTNDYKKYHVGCCSSECFNERGQPTIVPEIV